MYTGMLILGVAIFAASIVVESRGQAGAGATPPSNATLINTLRLGGVLLATLGLAGAAIGHSVGGFGAY